VGLRRTEAEYGTQLGQLLPPGRAWPREPDTWLGRLLGGLAAEFARVDRRGFDLLEEADPRNALELLPEWERLAGLPDPCRPIAESVRERRSAVAAKVAGQGGQTPAFFVELAHSAGYEVEIHEFSPFVAGSAAGDEVQGEEWRHTFLVEVFSSTPDQLFAAGAYAGDRLRTFGAIDLECLIGRARPAHSTVIFSYPVDPEPLLWFDFTTA